ncbi:family 78 glycoside hydrolase catalytic domain [Sphingopyxis sp.]|uniref:family 78 glycoside hydrolase catalytic domain n=1 Tax=Sphingopyxis sp. TaxID=1908224 RepID=UPI002DE67855|nr:family 78 glycoside hydrolase catalytic domain [Sphingopyxis sp.]
MEGAPGHIITDVRAPRFSWLLPSSVNRQTHYRIQVATSPAALREGRLVWDSGTVASSGQSGIVYAGPALQARETYYWRVLVTDSSGRSLWSASSPWEMSLLVDTDWQARWISAASPIEHDWSDAKTEWNFTWYGLPVDFLFRASPEGKTFGEAYVWRLSETRGQAMLTALSRNYEPSGTPLVKERVIKQIRLPLSVAEARARPLSLAVEARGTRIITRLDGRVVDELRDDDHVRGTAGIFQTEPRPGFTSPVSPPDAMLLHSIEVTPAGGAATTADFARNNNPLSGGTVTDGGLLPGNAKGIDIVFPLAAPAPLLRKSFLSEDDVVSARLYVAAGGFPRILLNGHGVGEPIADGFTAYDRRVLYRSYDVTQLVRRGENAIGVEMGRGWYDLAEPNEWYWHAPPWRARPALKLQLELTLRDGRRQTIASDDSWTWMPGPTLHDSIYAGERFDARRASLAWARAGDVDGDWRPVRIVGGPAGRLDAAKQQPIAVTETLRARKITEVSPGVWVFDFGRVFAGRVRVHASGPAGQTLSLTKHEKLRPDGSVWSTSSHVDAQLQVDRYIFAGRGVEEWAPQFGYGGFRYVELRGFTGTPTVDTLVGEVMHSDVASLGEFESSEPLVNAIHRAARVTILNNMHGFQTDTPTFEKNGWTGDAQASALAAALNFEVAPVWTKWLADFRDAQAPSGEIPEIVPATPSYGYEGTPGWSMVNGPTPAWDAAALIVPDDLYTLTGDRRVLADMYDTQRRLVDYTLGWFTPDEYRYKSPTNVLLGEYAMPASAAPDADAAALRLANGLDAPATEVDAVSTAYLYWMVDRLSRNAKLLGKAEDAERYAAKARQIRAAFNRAFWDGRRGFYHMAARTDEKQRFLQYLNVLPVVFGLVPDDEAAGVVAKVNEDIVAHDYHLSSTGAFSGRYLLTLLSDFGHGDTAWRLVTQTSAPSWGYWISNDIPTMLETWELTSRSYDHHYWGSVSSWFYQGLAGIRPAAPGYDRIVIKPFVPRDLGDVSATLQTVKGGVTSKWRQRDGRLELTVIIPGNSSAEIWCPGQVAQAPRAARPLRNETGYMVYSVPPGHHRFLARLD